MNGDIHYESAVVGKHFYFTCILKKQRKSVELVEDNIFLEQKQAHNQLINDKFVYA